MNERKVLLSIHQHNMYLHSHVFVNSIKWKLSFLDKIHIINLIKHMVWVFQYEKKFLHHRGENEYLLINRQDIHSFSLQNIFKELKSDIPDFRIPKHGTLAGWARQGILLLNACLTVEQHRANSHRGKGWEIFTVWRTSNK